jgi:hypothetical protein
MLKPASRDKLLALPKTSRAAYEVGYGKPPAHTRFEPGKSGNPFGRPKGAKSKLPALSEERLKTIIMEEAYRTIKVHEGERNVTIPMVKAVVRGLAVSAAKGNNRAANLFTNLVKIVEHENKELHFGFFRSALNYKDAWNKELRRRATLGITGPEPVPHPDDFVINPRTGEVKMVGPLTEEDQELWEVAGIVKAKLVKMTATLERKLKKNLGQQDRGKLLKELKETRSILSSLNETFRDEVIDRVGHEAVNRHIKPNS